MLADLHLISKAYKKGIDNRFSFERVAEIYAGVRGRLPHYLKKIVRTLDEEVEYLQNYLETKLPKGIIHGDLFSDNLMLKGEKVVAVLDFEAAGRGKFIFDLATAVNALCFESGRYALKRFESLIAGYESLRTLSLAEWDAFPNELRFSAFRFTVTRLRDFFLNPVDERKRINKDFQDFYERLLHPAPREGRRHGGDADGDGHRLRLPQVPEGQGRRAPQSLSDRRASLLVAARRRGRIARMNSDSLTAHVRGILDEIGEDPGREGLVKTPERVARALRFLTKGYDEDPQGGASTARCSPRTTRR